MPPRLNLPFIKRKKDPILWSYDHRAGLLVTIIAYLLFGIAFMSAKVFVKPQESQLTILIEFPMEESDELMPDESQERDMERHFDDFSDVRNLVSNDNATGMNQNLRDSRGTNASDLYGEVEAVQSRLAASQGANSRAIASLEGGSGQQQNNNSNPQTSNTQRQDSRIDGGVTVSYSFSNPVRNAVPYPIVPAYRCEGGGQVRLNVTLNRNGNVIAATVDNERSNGDACMVDMALEAARGTRFNLDASAPERQNGIINYVFIPQ
jgi:TonB family protein